MKLLLDTHVLLWWLFADKNLSPTVLELVSDRGNQVLISSASGWEIATKFRLGRLPSARLLIQDIHGWIGRAGFSELPISLNHAQRAGMWPQAHRDPFDRMLAAQSSIEDVPLATCDDAFRAFGIRLVW